MSPCLALPLINRKMTYRFNPILLTQAYLYCVMVEMKDLVFISTFLNAL